MKHTMCRAEGKDSALPNRILISKVLRSRKYHQHPNRKPCRGYEPQKVQKELEKLFSDINQTDANNRLLALYHISKGVKNCQDLKYEGCGPTGGLFVGSD